MKNKNIETFLGCDSAYDDAEIVVFGAPFDSTTSFRPGTRFASSVMRRESYGLEMYSPYLDKDMENAYVFDGGDLELCFGDISGALTQIEEYAAEVLADGKIPLMIGGEHLVTLGALRAAAKKYPDLYIVHFDAHTDLRDDYLGQKLSHATVMRRAWDIVGDGHIFQFGIRSGDRTEFEWAREHVFMNKFDFSDIDSVVEKLRGKNVYFSLDLDVLDPSVFPGTGTPEAGGVSFMELLQAMYRVAKLHIVGCDINELCPVYDQSGASTAVACKVLRELILSLS